MSELNVLPEKSLDDLLCEEHEKYMKQVSESGMPIWMLNCLDARDTYYYNEDNNV